MIAGCSWVSCLDRGAKRFDRLPLLALLVVLLFWCIPRLIQSAEPAPKLDWYIEGAGALDDFGSGVAVDSEGNVYFASSHQGPATLASTNISSPAFVLSKLSAKGTIEWVRTFPSDSTEMTQARLLFDRNDDLIVALSSSTTHALASGLSFAKLNKAGTVLWTQGRATSALPFLTSPFAAVDADGNYLFTFSSKGTFQYGAMQISSSTEDIITLKVNPAGQLIWARRGSGSIIDRPTGIVSDPESNFYMSGSFNSSSLSFGSLVIAGRDLGATTGFLCKFAKDGEPIWARTWHTLNGEVLNNMGMVRSESGEIAVCGRSGGSLVFGTNIFTRECGFVLKFDQTGTLLSSFKIDGQIVPFELAMDHDGQLLMAGNLSNSNRVGISRFGGQTDGFLAKFDTAGELLWSTIFGSSYTDGNYYGQLALGEKGEVYLGTTTFRNFGIEQFVMQGAGAEDAILLKFDSVFPSAPPLILQAPEPQTVVAGEDVVFSVVATNALTYQWYFGEQPITLATNAAYSLANATAANDGLYFVEVANTAGKVRSDPARLTVLPAISTNATVSTIAGLGQAGHLDSTNALLGALNGPDGPSVASDGTIYFADTEGNVIRYLTSNGVLGTLAGFGKVGYLDADGTNAYFSFPNGTRALRDGDILVTDAENDVLRRITGTGNHPVRTIAGDGARGYINGPALSARMAFPNDVVEDGSGTLYVSEFDNHVIRKISRDGIVSTLAGSGSAGSSDGVGTGASFSSPGGLAIDAAGNLFVTEFGGHRVRKITPQGAVSTIAGNGSAGYHDGPGSTAQFNKPNGIVAGPNGILYLTESGNHTIRRIRPEGIVETVAGRGVPGFADGEARQAFFNTPGGITIALDGSLIIADTGNHRIRKLNLGATPNPQPALVGEIFFGVTIVGTIGETYRIEGAEKVGSLHWIALTNLTLTSPVQRWIDPRPASNRTRIYRAVLEAR